MALPCDFEELANDIEIAFLRLFIAHALTLQSFQMFQRSSSQTGAGSNRSKKSALIP